MLLNSSLYSWDFFFSVVRCLFKFFISDTYYIDEKSLIFCCSFTSILSNSVVFSHCLLGWSMTFFCGSQTFFIHIIEDGRTRSIFSICTQIFALDFYLFYLFIPFILHYLWLWFFLFVQNEFEVILFRCIHNYLFVAIHNKPNNFFIHSLTLKNFTDFA